MFSPEVMFHSRVVGAWPVTMDCIVAMSSCENNNDNDNDNNNNNDDDNNSNNDNGTRYISY